ncbi:MAG: SpaH/EbpB family LPXTG-anchored major pilin [Atopobiaceae bacterium]|nr:SpaH/EbpB family LPXTG-anchored major pilin [Atopobiaceae bacterium]
MKPMVKRVVVAFFAFMLALIPAGIALGAGTGKITVADPGTESYQAYKIFNATSDTNGNVTYTVVDPWKDVIFNADGSPKEGVTGLQLNGTTVVKENSFIAADFAAFLKDNIPASATPITFTNATAENLDSGYYMVVSSLDNFANLQARAALTTVLDNEVTIQNKNDMPFDKTADDQKQTNVQVGDTINFKIEGVVPSVNAADTFYAYIVTDKMDEGLTFNNDLEVTIDGQRVALTTITDPSAGLTHDHVRYGENGYTFELSLDMEERGKSNVGNLAGKPVVITYSGTVNANAEGVVSKNFAQLEYGNNPNNLTVKDSETEHYTSKLVIDKFETDAPEQKLSGAKFVLQNSENKYYNRGTNDVISWVDNQSAATDLTTDTNGRAEFIGLADGNYKLIETEAPAGYTKLTSPITVVINGKPSLNANNTPEQIAMDLSQIVSVSNTPGTLMPSTGGMGTYAIYGVAAAALAGVAFMLIRRRSTN